MTILRVVVENVKKWFFRNLSIFFCLKESGPLPFRFRECPIVLNVEIDLILPVAGTLIC